MKCHLLIFKSSMLKVKVIGYILEREGSLRGQTTPEENSLPKPNFIKILCGMLSTEWIICESL